MIPKKILNETLNSGIAELGLTIPESIQIKLIEYIELLAKWNTVHNLTAIRDPLEMVKRHLLDSLSLLPFLPHGSLIDVGTGAGLPGIPLALCRPQETIVLLDSSQKKTTFVQHVILSLKLMNATIVSTRVEQYQPASLFKLVVSRAFAALAEFVSHSQHLCEQEGRLIAMKGAIDAQELSALPLGVRVEKIVPVTVPGVSATRTLVFIAKQTKGEGSVQ